MILNGQNHGVGRTDKGALLDCDENLPEADLAGEGVAVVDDGTAVVAIPAVELDTPAAGEEDLPVELHRGLTLELVGSESVWCSWNTFW